MKRRVEQLLNGIFEYEQSKLKILPEELTVRALPGAVVHGSFRLEGEDGKKVRGFLYSSNPRIVCRPSVFQGISSEIQYQIDCSGYEAGMQEYSRIVICSERGEYEIPVSVCVDAPEQKQEQIPVQSAEAFAALARKDFQSAYRWFLDPQFEKMLAQADPAAVSLYQGLGPEYSYQSMEEFLNGTAQKERIVLAIDREKIERKDLSESVRETLVLTKNTWGFQKILIESDASFLRPEKRMITTDEFAGSSYDLNVILDTNLMHAGKNYGRLTILTGGQCLQVEVTASRGGMRKDTQQNRLCKNMIKKMESLYVEFRLNKIDIQTWIEASEQVIAGYKRAGGQDPYADLFLVQLHFADGQKQKAYRVLEMIGEQRARLDTPDRYAFYLYLTTFFQQETSYVDRVENDINRMFCKDKTNWKLQWILLYLQEAFLRDDTLRYEAVAEQFQCGCRSRIMYLEALHILKKDPFLMHHLESFELHILRFAQKEEALSEELVRQTVNLTLHLDHFDPILFDVLKASYRLYPSADLTKAICHLLIKGEKKEPQYFEWYAKGVECRLRLTGLYEYYMETMDCRSLQDMPQIIRMYFAYDSTLDYRRRAAIYRSIAENREKEVQIYHTFRAAMEKFTLDQLEAGHITEDLAVLYRCFLRRDRISKGTAEKLARILFTWEVTKLPPQIRQIVVHSSRLLADQVVPVQNGSARIQIYDPDSQVFAVEEDGSRYCVDGFGRMDRVFEEEEMLAWCVQKAPEHAGMILYLSVQCLKEGLMHSEVLPYYCRACEMEVFSAAYRNEMRQKVLQYYVQHTRDDSLPDFLEQIPYLEYVKVDKAALITLLAEEGKCNDAFSLLDAYGAEGIELMQLVRICSRMVLDLEFEENSMLLSMCFSCFMQGKYDDKLLRYLLLYFEGPVQEMKQVWQAACEFELDTMLIEEKILTMMLFTRSGTQGSEPIFEAYHAKMGRKKLCRAYVHLKAYEYFVKELPVADSVFRYIEQEYRRRKQQDRLAEQEEVCRLALLKWYASIPELQCGFSSENASELLLERRKNTEELLEEFGARGKRFAFWRRFERALRLPYEMDGCVFVEYVTDPSHTVTIYYRILGREEGVCGDDGFIKESMDDYFEGIFVKEFILFEGEKLECYLEEEDGQEKQKTDRRILKPDLTEAEENSRYAMLNRMSQAWQQKEEEKYKEEAESYLMLEYLTEEVFTLV